MHKYIDITDEDEIENAFFNEEPACECGCCMEPIGDTDTFRCPDCGYTVDINDYAINGPFSDILSVYYADDVPGPGCRDCGNPAYPLCRTSCPLFDD